MLIKAGIVHITNRDRWCLASLAEPYTQTCKEQRGGPVKHNSLSCWYCKKKNVQSNQIAQNIIIKFLLLHTRAPKTPNIYYFH